VMMQMITVSKEEVLDPDRIPDRFRGQPPRPTTIEACRQRVEYWEYHVQRVHLQRFGPYAFEYQQKTQMDPRLLDRHLRAIQKNLDRAVAELQVAHDCACCGLLLTKTQDSVGPECIKHPDKFPCKRHRGKRR